MSTNGIATFYKVTFEQFFQEFRRNNPDRENLRDIAATIYDQIKLPTRATNGSAGYDFYIPDSMMLLTSQNYLIPTGIRCKIEPGWVLMLMPKSGLGTKFGLHMINTIGVIDSDYYGAPNEGHIMAPIRVKKNITLKAGDKFIQGVFVPFGTVTNDIPSGDARHGGFGSTGK